MHGDAKPFYLCTCSLSFSVFPAKRPANYTEEKQPQTSWSSEKQTDDEDVQRRLDTVESFYVSFDQEKEVQKLNTYSYADGCPGLSPVDHYCLFEDHFDQR